MNLHYGSFLAVSCDSVSADELLIEIFCDK